MLSEEELRKREENRTWKACSDELPPEHETVWTYADGDTWPKPLKRIKNLWFPPNMNVLQASRTPTHWRRHV